jgi:hypothetical protein
MREFQLIWVLLGLDAAILADYAMHAEKTQARLWHKVHRSALNQDGLIAVVQHLSDWLDASERDNCISSSAAFFAPLWLGFSRRQMMNALIKRDESAVLKARHALEKRMYTECLKQSQANCNRANRHRHASASAAPFVLKIQPDIEVRSPDTHSDSCCASTVRIVSADTLIHSVLNEVYLRTALQRQRQRHTLLFALQDRSASESQLVHTQWLMHLKPDWLVWQTEDDAPAPTVHTLVLLSMPPTPHGVEYCLVVDGAALAAFAHFAHFGTARASIGCTPIRFAQRVTVGATVQRRSALIEQVSRAILGLADSPRGKPESAALDAAADAHDSANTARRRTLGCAT